jgi:hypothetical protein
LHVVGSGTRLHILNSVLVSPDDAVLFDFESRSGEHCDMQCSVEQSTVAVGGAVLRLANVPYLTVLPQPVSFMARNNAFLAPFADQPKAACMVRFDHDALFHGLLTWQGQGNAYDRRLRYFALSSERRLPETPQSHSTWARLWGPQGDAQQVLEVPRLRDFVAEQSVFAQLDRLAMPQSPAGQAAPGADFSALRVTKAK